MNQIAVDISKDSRECKLDQFAHPAFQYGPLKIERNYSHGWSGADGIIAGLAAVERGDVKVAIFAVAQHHTKGDAVARVVVVGKTDDGLSWRFCGERHDPDGAGSHLLAYDFLAAVAVLATSLGRDCAKVDGGTIFRIA